MRRLVAVAVGLALAGAVLTGSVNAQVEAPGKKKAEQSALELAKEKAVLVHGTQILLILKEDAKKGIKEDTKVPGHVVRYDSKNKSLYVRTQPGELPVAYRDNDIKEINPITAVDVEVDQTGWDDLLGPNGRPSGLQQFKDGRIRIKPKRPVTGTPAVISGKDENRVRPAVDDQTVPKSPMKRVIDPEITKQIAYNGTQRTVVYLIANTVSPGEREILDQLQKAENDLMAFTILTEQRQTAIAMEMSMQEEWIKNLRLVNITMQNENQVNYPYPQTTERETLVPGFHLTAMRILTLRHPSKGVITSLPQVPPAPTGIVERLPMVDVPAFAKARDDYMMLLRTHAFFEDGRLVAVAAK